MALGVFKTEDIILITEMQSANVFLSTFTTLTAESYSCLQTGKYSVFEGPICNEDYYYALSISWQCIACKIICFSKHQMLMSGSVELLFASVMANL